MTSPDPIAAERAHYLALLGRTVDDPAVTLAELRSMTGAGVDVRSAAEAKITEQRMVAGSAFVRSVNGINPDINGNVTVAGSSSELSGTGSPTGVVTAPVGTLYVDEAITTGASIWSKRTGTGNTGWVVAVGDTDWQDYTTAWAAMFTDLAGYVTFSGSPSIRARRQGALVSIQVSGLQKVNAAAATMQAGLPSGWRATYALDYLAANSSLQMVRWYYPAGASAHVCQGPSIGGSFTLLLQFNTSDTWPATL